MAVLGAGSSNPARPAPAGRRLLDVDLTAGGFDLRLELRRLVLADAFLERLGRALDELLRLLEAEARDRPHFLDHLDLLVARGEQDHVELLLLRRGGCRRRRAA